MENKITIQLSVNSYIKKYLESAYGLEYKVSNTDDFGILILNTLGKKSTYYEYKREKDNRSDLYTIHISLSNFEKYGCTISERQLYLIHKSIDYNFRSAMYRAAIVNYESFGIQYKKSINAYLKSFDITEDELSYSTIRKDFNRKKADIQASLYLKGHN